MVSWQEQFLGLWWAVKDGAGLEVVLGGTPWRKLHKTLSVCDSRIEMVSALGLGLDQVLLQTG